MINTSVVKEGLTPGTYEGTMRGSDPTISESLRLFWDSQRDRAAQIYAFAVPNHAVIDALKKWTSSRGVVEVGAGTGYWARYIQCKGWDVTPYDICPPGVSNKMNDYHGDLPQHTTVF